MNARLFVAVAVKGLAGCVSAPSHEEIQKLPVNRTVTVPAPMDCLYEKAVKQITSRVWMSEPKPDGYINQQRGYAWFRQPLTIVNLKTDGPASTRITRQQTPKGSLRVKPSPPASYRAKHGHVYSDSYLSPGSIGS